jgi:hypothetical protein
MTQLRATTLGAFIAMTLAGGLASAATPDPLPLLAIGPDSSESPTGGDKTKKPCDNPARQSDSAKPTPYGSIATPGNAAQSPRDSASSSQAQDCNDAAANGANSGNSSRTNSGNDSNNGSTTDQDQNSSRMPAKKSGQR